MKPPVPSVQAVADQHIHRADEHVRGTAKIVPDSRMPRRLASVINTTAPTLIGTVNGHPAGHKRRDRGHAGRDRHRHRQHVVDQQGGRGRQAREHAQVVAGDDVAATAGRVGLDRLPIARPPRWPAAARSRSRWAASETGNRRRQHQHLHDLLGRIGHGGERVRREDRQRLDLGQALVRLARGGIGLPRSRCFARSSVRPSRRLGARAATWHQVPGPMRVKPLCVATRTNRSPGLRPWICLTPLQIGVRADSVAPN